MSAAPSPDRWERIEEVPSVPDVARWRARDRDTGEEVVWQQPLGDPARRSAFVAQMETFAGLRLPGIPRISVGADEARPYAVLHHRLAGTCERIGGPLPPPLVSAIGALLAPICLAGGAAMGGVLDPRDLAVDAEGNLWYSPTARAPNRVELGTARHVAPELLRGAPPSPEAALYGLGALLYRWLTGAPLPPPGRPRPAAGQLRPDAPRALTDAIDALLGPAPEARRQAGDRFTVGPIHLHLPRAAAAVAVGAPRREPLPVILRPTALRPADLPRIADHLRLTTAELQRWQASGAPLVLSIHDGIAGSERAVHQWRAQGLAAERWRPPGRMAWLGPGFAGAVSLVAAVTAGVGGWLELAPVVWTAGALATSFAGAAALAARQVALRTRPPVDLLGVTRPTAAGRARLRDAVRALEQAGWPDAAVRDLRSLAGSLERAFDAWDAAPSAGPGADHPPYERLLGAVDLLADGAQASLASADAEGAAQQALALVSAVHALLGRAP